MRLSDYLEKREESLRAFALRAGLPHTTVQRVAEGSVPRADTAEAIIEASREEPTQDGGTVTLADLKRND